MSLNRWCRVLYLGFIAGALALVFASCAQKVEITAPRYALVYGVSTYQSMYLESDQYYPYTSTPAPSKLINLSYSDDDANSIAALMQGEGCTVYSRIKGDVISNDPAQDSTPNKPTKAQMLADISRLASISSDATVILYFSGHGTTNGGTPYIVPYEGVTDAVNYSIDLSACVSPSDLNGMLSQLPTKNLIVIFDTCYSGGFVSPGSAIDASPQDYSSMPSFSAFSTAVANFGSLLSANASASGQKAPIVISAAGSEESSYDGTTAMQHGVFTYFLLQAASKGDSNGDGVVTTTEAFAYTQKAIISWGSSLTAADYANFAPFLPHISGGTRDLVLFTD